VLLCSAREKTGIEAIWETVLKHREVMMAKGELAQRRRGQSLSWMWSLVEEGLRDRFNRHPEVQRQLPHLARQVESGQLPPAAAAGQLLAFLDRQR
jgi:LAO/AO transport system kinase